jgi:transcription elongation factor Elf1
MSEVRMIDRGNSDRQAKPKWHCPFCGSDDLRYDHTLAGKGIITCGYCARKFSRKARCRELNNFTEKADPPGQKRLALIVV